MIASQLPLKNKQGTHLAVARRYTAKKHLNNTVNGFNALLAPLTQDNNMIETIWLTFHKQLLAFIRSQVHDQDNAEDILQNVFIKVINNLNQLTDQQKLQSWLYQICRHAIIDFYRVSKRAPSQLEQDTLDALVSENEDKDHLIQLNRCVAILINDLPDNVSALLNDSELEQIKQKDLAHKYNLSLPATKARILRGRQLLKKKLSACCDFEFSENGPLSHCRNKCGCE